MRRACKLLFRFSSTQTVQSKQSGSITTAEQKFAQTPVYLRPYDKAKYQVPLKKIKKNSGYALLQIEPFPRARIMRICYNILQQIKIQIPEDSERTKYVMEITDKTQDIQQLQDHFGTDSIQLFIEGLIRNLQFVQILRKHKFWQSKIESNQINQLRKIKSQQSEKYPIYKKGERPTNKFLDV